MKTQELIRILHVVMIMDSGGIDNMLMNLYRNIDRTKIQFDFLVHRTSRGHFEDEIERLGGRIYRLPPFTAKSIWSYHSKLKRLLKEHTEYQIIHSHISFLSYFPLKAAKSAQVPIRIAHSHEAHRDLSTQSKKRLPLAIVLKALLGNVASHFFACGIEAGKFLFGNRVNITVFPNAIKIEDFKYNEHYRIEKRKEFSIKDDTVLYGHVARYDYPKNFPFLLDLIKEISSRNKHSKYLLVGNCNEFDDFWNEVDRRGIRDHIIATGVRSDVNQLMQAMDVFLFPSRYEGLGIVAIEAQTAGLDCYISDCIPHEVKISKLAKLLPLSDGVKKWADVILNKPLAERHNYSDIVAKAGYGIDESSEWLSNFYLEQIKK